MDIPFAGHDSCKFEDIYTLHSGAADYDGENGIQDNVIVVKQS